MKSRHGQILVLVLLVVVVALAIGLSIASRNITNLRTSTQTNQSQRSFSAAEGGVEDILSRLNSFATDLDVRSPAGKNIPLTVGDISTIVNLKAKPEYDATIELGDVGQIKLEGATGSPTQIVVSWVKSSNLSESDFASGGPASIEWTLVRVNGGVVYQDRSAVSPTGSNHTSDQNPPDLAGLSNAGCVPASGYEKCTRISWPLSPNMPKVLRIKPFWNKTTVRVTTEPLGLSALPTQAYDLTSTATTALGITRRVFVTRTALPQLPSVFDYALYSDNSIER